MPESLFNIRMDDEDRALLEACAARDKLSKSDVLRRALRAYAQSIGVTVEAKPQPRARKRK